MKILRDKNQLRVKFSDRLTITFDWDRRPRQELYKDGVWVDAKGNRIALGQMSDRYLVNVAYFLARMAREEANRYGGPGVDFLCGKPRPGRCIPRGHVPDINGSPLLKSHPIWDELEGELMRRGLVDELKAAVHIAEGGNDEEVPW